MHQSIPAVPVPPGNHGAIANVASPEGRAFAYLGSTPGHLTSGLKPWSESRIRDGGVYRPRSGLRCRLASPSRTREARGCSWMILKVYFLNLRYFFISGNLYYIFISPIER